MPLWPAYFAPSSANAGPSRGCKVNNNMSKTTNHTQLMSTINKLHKVLTWLAIRQTAQLTLRCLLLKTISHLSELQFIVRISWNKSSWWCSSTCRHSESATSSHQTEQRKLQVNPTISYCRPSCNRPTSELLREWMSSFFRPEHGSPSATNVVVVGVVVRFAIC